MTNEKRKIFWETLSSLKGENIEGEIKILQDLVKPYIPEKICRFRNVSTRTLEALRTNKLYFSSANYYDDTFDTFLYINYEEIRNEILNFFAQKPYDYIMNMVSYFGVVLDKNILEKQMTSLDAKKVANEIIKYMKGTERNLLQESSLSICFSENFLNESLWLKYANNHRGFVLVYDMQDSSKFLCGKNDDCKNCPSTKGTPIYPIYYSDEKYDATFFAKYYAIACVALLQQGKPILNDAIIEKIISSLPPMPWEREKIGLIKKECHKYDEEWRIIAPFYAKEAYIKWIPQKIIFGLKMPQEEKELISSIAIQAGIEQISETYIDDKNNLNERCYEKRQVES